MSNVLYRDFNAAKDEAAMRACIMELQDYERMIYTRLPPGEAVVDDCIRHMLEQCRQYDGRIIVAEVDGAVAGFITVLNRVVSERPDDGKLEYGLISDLVVLDGHRGQGIGRALIGQAEFHAKASGVEWLRIGVIVGNSAAEHLYASMGFSPWHVEHEKRLT